jgi:Flp pilus assembly protein TadD
VALFFAGAATLGASEHFQWTGSQRRAQLDNLAALVPESGYANFMKASRLKAEGRADSAAFFFERAIRFDTAYRFSHALVADLKFQSGDTAGALRHYERAALADPEDAVVLENLARLYLATGRHAQAAEAFRALSSRDSRNPEFPYLAAWSLLQMKRGLDARPFLEKSLRLDSHQPKAMNYLGMIEQALGRKEAARTLYRKALELDSAYGHARENLAALDR